jgi:hypothetical protein
MNWHRIYGRFKRQNFRSKAQSPWETHITAHYKGGFSEFKFSAVLIART